MKATEMLEQIKGLLNINLSEEVKVTFAIEELSNGTKVEAAQFADSLVN